MGAACDSTPSTEALVARLGKYLGQDLDAHVEIQVRPILITPGVYQLVYDLGEKPGGTSSTWAKSYSTIGIRTALIAGCGNRSLGANHDRERFPAVESKTIDQCPW
jgi:hypothetical protein